MVGRTTLAAAVHVLGRWDEAAALFEEAERMWKAEFPAYLLLSSSAGFQYCDLLLDQGPHQRGELLRRPGNRRSSWATSS